MAPLVLLLMDDQGPGPHSSVYFYFHISSVSLTVLVMIGSEIVARFSPRLTPPSPNNPSAIINTLPFVTLNTAMALTIVFNVILTLSGIHLASGVQISLFLAALLARNKKAQKHLRNRLRQKIDSCFIGRRSRVEPVVTIAFVPVREFQGIQKQITTSNP